MKIKADTDVKVITHDNGNIAQIVPILKAEIEISLEEMRFLLSNDKLTFDVLMTILRHTSSEISRGVQIS